MGGGSNNCLCFGYMNIVFQMHYQFSLCCLYLKEYVVFGRFKYLQYLLHSWARCYKIIQTMLNCWRQTYGYHALNIINICVLLIFIQWHCRQIIFLIIWNVFIDRIYCIKHVWCWNLVERLMLIYFHRSQV